MERSGYKPHIQGGGSGSGFHPPESMLYDEPRVRNVLVKKIMKRAIRNEARSKKKEEKDKVSLWITALNRRVFLLDAMHKVSSYHSSNSMLRNQNDCSQVLPVISPNSTYALDCGNGSGTSEVPSKEDFSSAVVPVRSSRLNDPSHIKRAESDRFEVRSLQNLTAPNTDAPDSNSILSRRGSLNDDGHEDYSIFQVIPGMPRTIEEAVSIWRFGCPMSNGIPLKHFTDVDFRKANIYGYTDKKWRSGQRASLQRLKKLMMILSMSTDPHIPNIFDDDADEELWKSAIESFKRTWSGVALTAVLRRVPKK